MPNQVDMLAAALDAHDHGLCVVRASINGRKAPLGEWKHHQTTRPTRQQVTDWFGTGHPGMGVVCGEVSGNLEMFELEARYVAEHGTKTFVKAMRDHGLELLLKRLVNGMLVTSPSGGRHFLYRVDGPANGNTKLARRPSTPDELEQAPTALVQTLIETRGEGGFVVVPPSHGPVHPTGEPWAATAGGFATIPTITVAERDALYDVARTFDRTPPPAAATPVTPEHRAPISRYTGPVGGSWMDAVEHHLEQGWTMQALLEHYGWVHCYQDRHGRVLMRRPGKDDGVSGSINTNGRLCPFSTSVPFEVSIGTHAPTYNLLDVIAAYEHGGDRQAAGRAIADHAGITRTPAPTSPPRQPPPNVDPATGEIIPPPSSGGFDEAFWSSRPALEHIRTAARSRLVAPAAVLGAVLARIAAWTPPTTCLPPIVGSHAPLSLYVAFRGRSGAGKSSPAAAAADLLPVRPAGCVGPLALGSGEGLVEAFMELVEETYDDGGKSKKRKVKKQVHHGALFSLDEGQLLAEIANRRGSTVLPVLRTAWSGGDPGQANASIETRRSLTAGSYAVGLVSLWQDKAAAQLIADADGGTPQRFVWLPTDDPDATTTPPDWPGPIDWQPPAVIATGGKLRPHPLELPADIEAGIREARVAELRGAHTPDPLDAHRRLNKLKVAGVLAVLDQRAHITFDDWELAETILTMSDQVRSWVIAEARRSDSDKATADAERYATREAIVERSAADRALGSAARAAHRAAVRANGHAVTKRQIHATITSRDRQHVTTDDAIAEAERLHWIAASDGGWVAGDARPA